jgi:hypothetical protein
MTEHVSPNWEELTVGRVVALAKELDSTIKVLEDKLAKAENLSRLNAHLESRQVLVNVLKGLVSKEELETELASEIYEGFANGLNKDLSDDWSNPFAPKWTVTVRYNRETIKVIENIEADSADDAVEAVRDDLEVKSVTLSCELEYSGDGDDSCSYSDTIEADDPEWDLLDELEITAEPAEA